MCFPEQIIFNFYQQKMKHHSQKYLWRFAICLFAFFLLFNSQLQAQHKKRTKQQKNSKEQKEDRTDMHLTFNEEGKLLDGYLPRYNPDLCKDGCENNYTLTVRVLLPVDFLDDENDLITEKSEAAYLAVRNTKSTLYKILSCPAGKDKGDIKLMEATIFDKDMRKWKNTDLIMPKSMFGYLAFIDALKAADVEKLNGIKLFAPFRLKVKGMELDTLCMQFKPYGNDDPCKCVSADKKYVVLEFGIPPKLITKSMSVDFFQLIRKFEMKQQTIDWYNKMLKSNKKEELMQITFLENSIRTKLDTLTRLLVAVDSLNALDIYCKDLAARTILEKELNTRICVYKKAMDIAFGRAECKDGCTAALFCSAFLRDWITKLIWLNGDDIRLNPFDFTTGTNISLAIGPNEIAANDLKQKQKNAATQLKFWETAITHLEDSILRAKDASIGISKLRLDSLLSERDKALAILAKKVSGTSETIKTKNTEAESEFLKTSQVNYKGWLVPYQTTYNWRGAYKPDKMWVRNYYLNLMPNPLRQKLHFTYPEDENVTLLLHNISAGTGMIVTESLKPYADSAEFTIVAGEFVTQAAALYGSLGKIAPVIKGLLKGLNNQGSGTSPVGPAVKTLATLQDATSYLFVPKAELEALQPFDKAVLFNNMKFNTNSVTAKSSDGAEVAKFLVDGKANNQKIKIVDSIARLQDVYRESDITISSTVDKAIPNGRIDLRNVRSKEAFLNKTINFPRAANQQIAGFIIRYKTGANNLKADTIFIKTDARTDLANFADSIGLRFVEETKVECVTNIDKCYGNYLKALVTIAAAPAFIGEPLKARPDTTPIYYTGRYQLGEKEAPYQNQYKLMTYTQKDGDSKNRYTVDSSYIKVGKFRYLQTAAGVAYTPNAGFITSVDTSNGGFNISRDDDRFRLIAGLRWYPLGLYNQKNPVGVFNEFRWLHRLSVLVATGIPKPFQNIYLGGGFDVVPGLNLSAGFHFQQQNKFTILNNQVKDRSVAYRGHAFYSITVDPNLLINAITSFF